jgi:hypothetical protein
MSTRILGAGLAVLMFAFSFVTDVCAQSELYVEVARDGVPLLSEPGPQANPVVRLQRGTVFQVVDLRETSRTLYYKVRATVDGRTLNGFLREEDVNQTGTQLAAKKPLASDKFGFYVQRTVGNARRSALVDPQGRPTATYSVYSVGLFVATGPPVQVRTGRVGVSFGIDGGLTSSHPYGKSLFHLGSALGPEFAYPFGRSMIATFTPAIDASLLFQPTGENAEGEEQVGVRSYMIGGRALLGLSFGARSRFRAEAGVRGGYFGYRNLNDVPSDSEWTAQPVLRVIVTFPFGGIMEEE